MARLLTGMFMIACFSLQAQNTDSLKVVRILQKMQQNYASLKSMSYYSFYRQVNDSMEDSVFSASGKVWISFVPSDTIFGGVFHLKGEDKNGSYDYYYDGQKSYELRHKDKAITVFNPYAFTNNDNNPAKARTAMLIFQSLPVNRNLAGSMLENKPQITLHETPLQWIIVLAYPKNKFAAQTNDTLFVWKLTLLLAGTGRITYWNGTVFRASYMFNQVSVNQQSVTDSIPLTASYSSYKMKEYKRGGEPAKEASLSVGIQAPAFTYPTFNGNTVSLKDFTNKYVLLDFWETWCGYCILALPQMKELYNSYHNKGLEIIGITTENEKQVALIIQKNQLPYLHVKGDSTILKNYSIVARPGYVLIDKAGKVIFTNRDDIEKFLVKPYGTNQ